MFYTFYILYHIEYIRSRIFIPASGSNPMSRETLKPGCPMLPFSYFPRFLLHLAPEDLAHGALRQGIDELDALRDLVGGEPLPAVAD